MEKISFAARLIEARTQNSLSQSDIARGLGISPQAVQKWEKGESAPRSTQFEVLERLLGRSRQWLMFGCEDQSGMQTLVHEINELRSCIEQSLSCITAAEHAENEEKVHLIAAAKRILQSTKDLPCP